MKLPYFKWFPADAETDADYVAMDDTERGLYHHALNICWTNHGLPVDVEERARVLSRPIRYIQKHWKRIGRKFQEVNGILVNPRQEKEREKDATKSKKASESVGKRRDRHQVSPIELTKPVYERKPEEPTNVSSRAYDCESVSDSSLNLKPEENTARARVETAREPLLSRDFPQFWQRWCELTKRKQKQSNAQTAWISVVEPEFAPAAMACLERYGASDEVSRGIVANPDNWIYTQARDNFTGEWQRVHRNGHGPPEPEYPKELM